MKKLLFLLTALVLLAMTAVLPVDVYAAEVPEIKANPQSCCWPEGSTAVWTCECAGDTHGSKYTYTWYLCYGGETYNLSEADGTGAWESEIGEAFGNNGNQLLIEGISANIHDARLWCEVSSATDTVKSTEASVLVGSSDMGQPAEIVVPVSAEFEQGDSATLTCYVSGSAESSASYVWYTSYNGSLSKLTMLSADDKGSRTVEVDTENPLVTYYICAVTVGDNTSFSSPILVTVDEKEQPVALEIVRTPSQLAYAVGDSPNLSGMKVRMLTNMGSYDIEDNSRFTVEPERFTESGKITVTLTYDGEFTASFDVTVSDLIPVITEQPQSTETDENSTAVFTCKAENAVSWQWYVMRSGTNTAISYPEEALNDGDYGVMGVHTESLTVTATEQLANSRFFCRVYNKDGETVTSELVRLTVIFPEADDEEPQTIDEAVPEQETSEVEQEPAETQEPGNESGRPANGVRQLLKIAIPMALLAGCLFAIAVLLRKNGDE